MTILETIPIMEQAGSYNSVVLWSMCISLVCVPITSFLLAKDYDTAAVIFCIGAVIALIIFLTSTFLAITEPKIDTGRKQYIIRLNNNININEFYDKYKIVEHTKYTDIYTVEEIND